MGAEKFIMLVFKQQLAIKGQNRDRDCKLPEGSECCDMCLCPYKGKQSGPPININNYTLLYLICKVHE